MQSSKAFGSMPRLMNCLSSVLLCVRLRAKQVASLYAVIGLSQRIDRHVRTTP